jgi:hypothetical protein
MMLGSLKYIQQSLVSKASVLTIEMASEKPKRYKPPGIDQISAETIKAGSRVIHECGSLSPWHGASSSCGWRNSLQYGGKL